MSKRRRNGYGMVGGLTFDRTPTEGSLLQRAQAKASTVIAECSCGTEVYRCSLRGAQAQNETTNLLIRQAIKKHSCTAENAGQVMVRVETTPSSR